MAFWKPVVASSNPLCSITFRLLARLWDRHEYMIKWLSWLLCVIHCNAFYIYPFILAASCSSYVSSAWKPLTCHIWVCTVHNAWRATACALLFSSQTISTLWFSFHNANVLFCHHLRVLLRYWFNWNLIRQYFTPKASKDCNATIFPKIVHSLPSTCFRKCSPHLHTNVEFIWFYYTTTLIYIINVIMVPKNFSNKCDDYVKMYHMLRRCDATSHVCGPA